MIVTLEAWEYEHAYQVGIRRFTENWTKKDASYYDKSKMEEDRNAQPAAAICELAVAKHVNQYWSGHVWTKESHNLHKGKADVGTNIEVKRVRTKNAVAVRQKQVGKGLFLFAARAIEPEFRQVEILGWIDYDTAWALGEDSEFHQTKYLSLSELNKLVDKGNR
jgi:hypothetical protein